MARGVELDSNVCSSPQVRGRSLLRTLQLPSYRLIPAGAGQIDKYAPAPQAPWAHPRGCGADTLRRLLAAFLHGSSPRVRGRCRSLFPERGHCRLIPAGAGQIQRFCSALTRRRAHPRGCGADWVRRQRACRHVGSSPRVRGRFPRQQPGG